ncbi:hypothetical protein J8V57_09600 [Xenorhabdus sp. PB61.4]|uniref:Uncharacterized protein n=1 Tax=Xenorhabdus stockiae TaxID=351614 RepID=A0A2D0KBF1_9GAMM|nr:MULTISPECIES: hypothetical protein [Xenorhabdus]MCC8366534.1 hypothetical protein [Xenorhabdus sp. PB61.4]PHM60537.1 hypothetical protein Xsto_03904 [Xenorhabdus stockiae]
MCNVIKIEDYKRRAKELLLHLPKEDGFTFIPNQFLEDLLKEDFSVDQFNEILGTFRPEVANG